MIIQTSRDQYMDMVAYGSNGREGDNKCRILFAIFAFVVLYGLIASKLIVLGLTPEDAQKVVLHNTVDTVKASRPDLVDRNGSILATDIKTASLYAEPRRIEDVDETIEKLSSVLPEMRTPEIRKKLASNAGFVWLKRELSPIEQKSVHNLGLPGVGFRNESQRFYPGNNLVSHIVGHVNVDNQGIAGLEKYLDESGLADLQNYGFTSDRPLKPVSLSVDIRAQHAVREELIQAMERYRALAAVGIVLNANTGEVVAMSSLPDYNPNHPGQALDERRLNRATAGVFEMGSVMKMLTVAMALDSGYVSITDSFDASQPIRKARHTIRDYRGKNRILDVPEVFIYSSNIGTAKMALEAGIDTQKNFLGRTGMLGTISTELPEVARPLLPRKWDELEAMTISFGHGLSVSPMHTAVAASAVINGGKFLPPTFFRRTEETAEDLAVQVLSKSTSDTMRFLLRKNMLEGSGTRSNVKGYLIGGKTGTAEKVVNGKYDSSKRFNSFIAGFPIDEPQYLVLVALDEPQPEEGSNRATAGLNAGPTAAAIVRRIAPMLGVHPNFVEPEFEVEEVLQEQEKVLQEQEEVVISNVSIATTY